MLNQNQISKINKTTINNDLLKGLLLGRPQLDGFLNNGHSQGTVERQLLSYIVLQALKIVRLPHYYDFKFDPKPFEKVNYEELELAVTEARRIYDHTQTQFRNLNLTNAQLRLKRGIGERESAVMRKLLELIPGDQIKYYFQTITFFNCNKSAFQREINLTIDCPIEWIWCCTYTIEDFSRFEHIDDEFLIVNNHPTGILNIPKTSLNIQDSHPFKNFNLNYLPSDQPVELILSLLTQNRLNVRDIFNNDVIEYRLGKWESFFLNFGREIDRKFSSFYEQGRLTKRTK